MRKKSKTNIRELENEFYDSHVSYSIIALANLISLNTMKNTLDGIGNMRILFNYCAGQPDQSKYHEKYA